jgi:hypothetical protein
MTKYLSKQIRHAHSKKQPTTHVHADPFDWKKQIVLIKMKLLSTWLKKNGTFSQQSKLWWT